ncbi:MAG: tetratricopeptide repeat protein [Acidobacteriaceae bacterium]
MRYREVIAPKGMVRSRQNRAARLMCTIAAITTIGCGIVSAQTEGQTKTFAGSGDRAETNIAVLAEEVPSAGYCGGCHKVEFDEWHQSLHANSFRTPFYHTSDSLLILAEGLPASAHCDTCHNPLAVQFGALAGDSHSSRGSDQDGVTCMVCHSITRPKSTTGDGSYVMGTPAVMVDAKGNRIPGEVPYHDILAHPDRHRRAVMQDFYRTSEFCAACHNATVPAELNNYKPIREFATYDEWQSSAFSHQDPLNFYPEQLATCQDCHMPRLPESSRQDGDRASHRWVAGNTAVPFYYGYKDQLQKTIDFLQSMHAVDVDIVGIEKAGGDRLIAPLGSVPFDLEPKSDIVALVIIRNSGIGHSLLPELRDLYEAWIEFRVTDRTGREIVHSGFLNSDGTLDQYAHAFLNRPLDQDGDSIENHEIWRMRSIGYDNTIAAGGAAVVRYEFRIPENTTGPITITAQVKYRHFQQRYLNTVLGSHHPAYPVVILASQTRTLMIGGNRPQPAKPDQSPDWMRWNNLGIACLGPTGGSGFVPVPAEEYEQAVAAFSEVVKLRPQYVDGYTNLALAHIESGNYDAAEMQLRKAIGLDASNARALYYMALVEKHRGAIPKEITDLEEVAKQYPESRDARRELGIAYRTEGRDQDALREFVALQQIVPDDLTAHQELASLYRKFGMTSKAAEEEAAYNAEKPDPAAPTYSFNFLREHPEIILESLPWHVHSLSESDLAQRR